MCVQVVVNVGNTKSCFPADFKSRGIDLRAFPILSRERSTLLESMSIIQKKEEEEGKANIGTPPPLLRFLTLLLRD